MRPLFVLALITAFAISCEAAKRATVGQLEQALNADIAAHKSEEQIARRLDSMELSERLTETTLSRLTLSFAAGSPPALALQLLADQSAFLDPPENELPPTPAPDEATQTRILQAARDYADQVLPHLPDLLATRTTFRFDNSPQVLSKDQWPVRIGLHLVDTSSHEISIRDQRETHQGSAFWQAGTGLTSGGEFGSILAMVLSDTAKSKVTWSHWEQTADGRAGVFHFFVPKSDSHFEVISSLEREGGSEMTATPHIKGRTVSTLTSQPNISSANNSVFRDTSAYNGSLWIDPEKGTIFRIAIEGAVKSETLQRAAILVQYGPVQMGGNTFICPVRSLALSSAIFDPQALQGDSPTEWLNETVFTSYHRFGSSVTVVPETQKQ